MRQPSDKTLETGGGPARRRGRPPKAAPNRAQTRERLIRHGIALLTEHGFARTGIDGVLKAVGVPKGSFYHYFSSKDDFGGAVIDGYAEYFARKLDRTLNDARHPPLENLRSFIADARAGMERFDYRRGCLVGNLGQELGATHDRFRRQLEAVFNDWQVRVADCLRAAIARGDLSADADCDRLAAFFWIGWEGAILRAKLTRSPAPLELFAEAYFAMLPITTQTQDEENRI